MKISTKGTYALRIMTDMAIKPEEMWTASMLAEKNNLSAKYLEKIISQLLKAGLLTSHRGSSGGYKLSRSPKDISLGQIILATEGRLQTVSCVSLGAKCDLMPKCLTATVWAKLDNIVNDYLNTTSLQDVVSGNIK